MPPNPGPKPTGKALSNAERQRRYMERLKANRVTNAVAELQTELASARDHADRLQAELTEALALVGHLQAENARLKAALNPVTNAVPDAANPVTNADNATGNPVTDGKARGYPLEVKRGAVALADSGATKDEVVAWIETQTGLVFNRSNYSKALGRWRAAAG